jgi:hypothetical protein
MVVVVPGIQLMVQAVGAGEEVEQDMQHNPGEVG